MDVRGVKIVIAVALVALLGALAAAPTARSGEESKRVALSSLESGVLSQLNKIRAQHGLQPVQINARLTAAAAQHSKDMGAAGYFAHDSNDGTAFSPTRLGLDHFAFTVATQEGIEQWAQRLTAAGVEHSGVIEIPPGAILNFKDPDGVALALFWDR